MKQKRVLQLVAVFTFFFSLSLGLFGNCSIGKFSSATPGSSLPLNHPPIDEPNRNYQQTRIPILDLPQINAKMYVSFLGQDEESDSQAYLRSQIQAELLPIQQAVGGICEPARIGSLAECNYTTSHLTNRLDSTTSTTREAARMQVCMRLTSDDSILLILINRIKGKSAGPEWNSILALVQQFYPAWEDAELIDKLLAVDRELAGDNESTNNRWRFLTQLVCESPGWQVL